MSTIEITCLHSGNDVLLKAKTGGLKVNQHIGSRIRERREALCFSIDHLAFAINVSDDQLLNYESGVDRVAANKLFALAEALHISIGWFFDDMLPSPIEHLSAGSGVFDMARNLSASASEKYAAALSEFADTLATLSVAARRPLKPSSN